MLCTHEVTGSIPVTSTSKKENLNKKVDNKVLNKNVKTRQVSHQTRSAVSFEAANAFIYIIYDIRGSARLVCTIRIESDDDSPNFLNQCFNDV